MGAKSSITIQSLGKIAQCAPAVGAIIWCLFSLPPGCHGNLPVLDLLSALVAKNQHFRFCVKNCAFDRKMIDTY